MRAEAKLFKNGEEIHREDGEIQLLVWVSGICIFNLSKMMRFEPGDTFQALRLSSRFV